MSRVFIGGMPIGVRQRDIERFLKGYGRITEIFLKIGYCFVEFEDRRDADDVIEELHGQKMKGVVVTVQAAQNRRSHTDKFDDGFRNERYGRPEHKDLSRRGKNDYGLAYRTKNRLIVKNLSVNVDWKQLKDYMRQGGKVTYCEAHKKHLSEGVIEFASIRDLKNAVRKLNDTKLNGKRIQLLEDRYGEYGSPNSSRSPSPKRRVIVSSISRPVTQMERTPTLDLSYPTMSSSSSKEFSLKYNSPMPPSTKRSKRSSRGHQKDGRSSDRVKRVNPFR